MAEQVVVVDADGSPVGAADKTAAHTPPGQLHLAFSVFLFRPDGRVLLQQRAAGKHHFALRWSNSCCSHPRPGEPVLVAAGRRLQEELGLDTGLLPAGYFLYAADDPASGLVERELDHVLVGDIDRDPVPNPDEVAAYDWLRPAELHRRLTRSPDRFTPWFAPAFAFAEHAVRG